MLFKKGRLRVQFTLRATVLFLILLLTGCGTLYKMEVAPDKSGGSSHIFHDNSLDLYEGNNGIYTTYVTRSGRSKWWTVQGVTVNYDETFYSQFSYNKISKELELERINRRLYTKEILLKRSNISLKYTDKKPYHTFTWVDYNNDIQVLTNSIVNKQLARVKSLNIPPEFIPDNIKKLLHDGIVNSQNNEDVAIYKQMAEVIYADEKSNLRQLQQVARSKQSKNSYVSDYQRARQGSLAQQKQFIGKYQSYFSHSTNCYRITPAKLNIRRSPNTSASIMGRYSRGQQICAKEERNGWIKGNKGWVSKKYVSRDAEIGSREYFDNIVAAIDKQEFEIASKKNSVESYKQYLTVHADGSYLAKANIGLIGAYRNLDSFDGYMQAYELSKSKSDIASAYKRAKTSSQYKQVELTLFNSFSAERFINVEIVNSRESELRESTSSGLAASFRGMTRDYTNEIIVSLDRDAGMPFKYGSYRAKISFKLLLDYTTPINGRGEDYSSNVREVELTPENNYTVKVNTSFSDIPVSGKYHLLAATMASGIASLFGLNVDSSSADIETTLTSTKLTYDVVDINAN
eukprot:TRINITY_DN6_c0_g9_i1.p1 TRINITY_DN6_c0_g9~~TRINITY_DN6_c0_g9_i1.p1  ORF type:complete len:574 (-),score=98.29 TRINITY_DN6_c0_g9_i1:688-2409(-)